MNSPQSRTRHRNPHDGTMTAEVRGLYAIILLAISVIHFRFDEMTTPHSLAIERLLAPLSAAREANRCACEPRVSLVRGQTETSPAGWPSPPAA
jgi:hypothetical protein